MSLKVLHSSSKLGIIYIDTIYNIFHKIATITLRPAPIIKYTSKTHVLSRPTITKKQQKGMSIMVLFPPKPQNHPPPPFNGSLNCCIFYAPYCGFKYFYKSPRQNPHRSRWRGDLSRWDHEDTRWNSDQTEMTHVHHVHWPLYCTMAYTMLRIIYQQKLSILTKSIWLGWEPMAGINIQPR